MTRLDLLRKNYHRVCGLPWDRNLAGPQRVWMAVYDSADERKLRLRLGEFGDATEKTGHRWHTIDLTDAYPAWMCGPANADYAASYFESPDLLDAAVLADFKQAVVAHVRAVLDQVPDADDAVLALYGVASLFGFVRVSELLPLVENHVRGRLLVFFPGVYDQDNYRLLDAQDGWNYHAVPITPTDAEARR